MTYLEYSIDYAKLSGIYSDLIKYAADKCTYISFITYLEKPYSKRPPNCYHDKLTERVLPFLVKQHVGIRKWANGGINDNHLVMNIYKIEPGIRKRMLEIGNLFLSIENDLPFDLCIYRDKEIWLSTICHEKLASVYNPTENDMKFFKDHGIDLSLWGKFDYPPFKLDLSKNPD